MCDEPDEPDEFDVPDVPDVPAALLWATASDHDRRVLERIAEIGEELARTCPGFVMPAYAKLPVSRRTRPPPRPSAVILPFPVRRKER